MLYTTHRNSGGTLSHSSERRLLGGIVDKLFHFLPYGNKEGTFCCTLVEFVGTL